MIILTDNKSFTRFFRTKIFPPTLWNACDYVIQFNFTIAHIPGKNNTAADCLSRLEISPKEKLILRIREDIPTKPIELHVQSAGVSEEEQFFYTEDDNETEEQILKRKKAARDHPTNQLPDISFEKFATHKSDYYKLTTLQKLTYPNSIAVEKIMMSFYNNCDSKYSRKTIPKPFCYKTTATNSTVVRRTDCPSWMKLSPDSILTKPDPLNTTRSSYQNI